MTVTSIDRSTWLQERRQGIGGSDIASVFNVGYGCRRALWYDKRDTPQDFPWDGNTLTRLGTHLEPFFADLYAEQTGRKLTKPVSKAHPDHPEIRVNADRLILILAETLEDTGVLEIKSVGRAVFYRVKREGLPEDYILQLQHAMLVHGATWGAFAVGNRDTGELLHWDVERNEDICNQILEEAPKFWALVENGPAPDALDPDDRRCQSCPWRRTCQGEALIQRDDGEMPQAEELRPLLTEYDERKSLYAQAEELYDDVKEQMRTVLGDRQAVMVGERKVYFRPQAGKTLYRGKELMEAYRNACRYITALLVHVQFLEDPPNLTLPLAETFIDTSKPSRPLRIF